mgnify:CR=1 FL=1|tara:strand:+ start:8438 stop:8803 length:366 start_codon:yes stop_codon:yes gene_type:complete
MTEAQLQNLVADYLRVALPDGSVFHHSPNEGKSHVAHRVKLKKAGMRTGWPDLEIFCPDTKPIFIELKVGRNRVTPEQNKTLNNLASLGCVTAVCKSLDEVRKAIGTFVKLKEKGGVNGKF